jgi:hypothetical protein
MYIRIRETNQVILDWEIRSYFPNALIPNDLTEAVLDSLGCDLLLEGPDPEGATVYQYKIIGGAEQIDGKWYVKYALGPVFTDSTDGEGITTTAAQKEAAYKAERDNAQSNVVRIDRNEKLKQCDWTQVADAPVDKTVWATYRQALRDVTTQSGFPWSINWPTEP